jgi:hypothetical protein
LKSKFDYYAAMKAMESRALTAPGYDLFRRAVNIDLGLYRFDLELGEAGMNGAINKLIGYRAVLDGIARNHITDANKRNAYCFRCVANEARSAMQDIPGHPQQMIYKMNERIGAVCNDLLQQNILQLWTVIQQKSQWGMGNWDKNSDHDQRSGQPQNLKRTILFYDPKLEAHFVVPDRKNDQSQNGVVRQPQIALERLYRELPSQLLEEAGHNIKQQLPGLIPEILSAYDAPMFTDEITLVVLDLLCLPVDSLLKHQALENIDAIYDELLALIGNQLNARQKDVLKGMLANTGLDVEDRENLAKIHRVDVRTIYMDEVKIRLLLRGIKDLQKLLRPYSNNSVPPPPPNDEFPPDL